MRYKFQILDDEKFNALPGRNMEENYGVAYPEKGEAYVRHTGDSVVDAFNIAHELEHLEGKDLNEAYDKEFKCYYKKGKWWNPFGGNFLGPLHNYIAPIAATAASFIPGVGPAIGGALGSLGGALGNIGSGGSGALGNIGGFIQNLFGGGAGSQGGYAANAGNIGSSMGYGIGSGTAAGSAAASGGGGNFLSNLFTGGRNLLSNLLGGGGGSGGGGFQNQTGINTGDPTGSGGSNFLNDLFNGIGNLIGGKGGVFQDVPSALAGGGVLGIGELLNKKIDMPDFQSIPQVQALSNWSQTANHPLDPNVRESIQNTLNIQNEQQLRNLRDVYKNLRPGSDYTTDSAYQRDLERLNRSMAMQGADAMAGSQLASNQMHLGNLGNLAQLAVGQNLGQAGIEAQRQQARNRMFGNIGGMLGYKGIFGDRGPGIMSPWNQNLGQGVS